MDVINGMALYTVDLYKNSTTGRICSQKKYKSHHCILEYVLAESNKLNKINKMRISLYCKTDLPSGTTKKSPARDYIKNIRHPYHTPPLFHFY
jgi:hypothetical protein